MRNAALESAIIESDNVETYDVYGDWLEEQGHPRGELISLQIAGLDKEWNQLLVDEAAAFDPIPHGVEVEWRYGFWDTITVCSDHVDLAALLALPSAAVARRLHLKDPGGPSGYRMAELERADVSSIENATLDGLARMLRDDRDGLAWLGALPAMQRLQLGHTLLRLEDVEELTASDGRTIASIRGLERLYMSAHHLWPPSIERDAIRALAPLADSLIALAVTDSSHFDDAACEMLAAFHRLEELSVRHTVVTARGLAHLARLPKLRELEIGNFLDASLVDQIVATFPALKKLIR